MHSKHTRRLILARLGAALALPALLARGAARERSSVADPVERLTRALGPQRSVAAIGRCHLQARAGAFDAAAVARALVARIAAIDPSGAIATRLPDHVLHTLIDSDLRAGRIVLMSGWVLAQCEADLCTLYAFRRSVAR
jgi:hypothetical protein